MFRLSKEVNMADDDLGAPHSSVVSSDSFDHKENESINQEGKSCVSSVSPAPCSPTDSTSSGSSVLCLTPAAGVAVVAEEEKPTLETPDSSTLISQTPRRASSDSNTPKRRTQTSASKKQLLSEERKRKAEARQAEKERIREEKIRKKREVELEKQQRRDRLEKEKADKQKQKDRERAEKERIKQAQKEEKERKEKEKQEERQRKLEEVKRLKEEKDAEKRQKEEEKRKLEEEKQKEEDNKKRKIAKQQEIMNAFVIKKETPLKQDAPRASPFLSFQVKDGMVLAPVNRRGSLTETDKAQLDNLITYQSISPGDLYLKMMRKQAYKAGKSSGMLQDDVVCLDDVDSRRKMKAKFLQFDGGRDKQHLRPAYYGTFGKTSQCIRGRCPFGKDQKLLDYDVDSGEEWEEEPEGDECKSSDEEEEEEEQEDDDDNDGWMVPHGYLSDNEGISDEDDECADAESRRRRLEAKAETWKAERMDKSKKFTKLHPVIIGPIMLHQRRNPGEEKLLEKLEDFKMIFLCDTPVRTRYNMETDVPSA